MPNKAGLHMGAGNPNEEEMNPNIEAITGTLLASTKQMSPADLSKRTGLSIDAVRRALKAALKQEDLIVKKFVGRFTFYEIHPSQLLRRFDRAPKVVRRRTTKGRSVFDWFLDGKRLPQARDDRLVALRRAGVPEKMVSRVVG